MSFYFNRLNTIPLPIIFLELILTYFELFFFILQLILNKYELIAYLKKYLYLTTWL